MWFSGLRGRDLGHARIDHFFVLRADACGAPRRALGARLFFHLDALAALCEVRLVALEHAAGVTRRRRLHVGLADDDIRDDARLLLAIHRDLPRRTSAHGAARARARSPDTCARRTADT